MAHKCDGCRYKGEHKEMMFRPMGVCNRGANLLEAIRNYDAEKCPYIKTNADRFRKMTDEEQQAKVRSFFEIEDFADWLKQPAEE